MNGVDAEKLPWLFAFRQIQQKTPGGHHINLSGIHTCGFAGRPSTHRPEQMLL
jgi:hypothetical protein